MGQVKLGRSAFSSLVYNYLDGLVQVVAQSPVRIDAVAPDGTRFDRPGEAIDGVPPSEHVYLTGAAAGEYNIRVEGTDDGEYTLDVVGTVPDGGSIDRRFTATISEGETQTLTARIPNGTGSGDLVDTPDQSSTDDSNPFEPPGPSGEPTTEESIGAPGLPDESTTEGPFDPPGPSGEPTTERSIGAPGLPDESTTEGPFDPPGPGDTPTATPTPGMDDSATSLPGSETGGSFPTEDPQRTAGSGTPGFGLVSTLASLGGLGYLLSRRLDDEKRESE
jgi:hypothetical protein